MHAPVSSVTVARHLRDPSLLVLVTPHSLMTRSPPTATPMQLSTRPAIGAGAYSIVARVHRHMAPIAVAMNTENRLT